MLISEQLKGGLIVSCQALENEPLHGSHIMVKMAEAAISAGAVGIRAQGCEDIQAIKASFDIPVIGLIKKDYEDSEVYITATKKEVSALLETDCEIIALDATLRSRPNDEKLEELVSMIHQAGRKVMADCSTLEDACNAEKIGCDYVSTTLSGYTKETKNRPGPDLELIGKLIKTLNVPVIAEGRIHTYEEFKEVLKLDPFSVVVGGAITRPQEITSRFIAVLEEHKER